MTASTSARPPSTSSRRSSSRARPRRPAAAKVIVYDVHAPALLRHARRYASTRDVILERLVVAGSLEETLATQTEAREALALQELQSLPKLASSVRPPSPDAPLVVVDARELRSEVPPRFIRPGPAARGRHAYRGRLHYRRLAVERKNVDTNDLHSSLESGRLWTQLRASRGGLFDAYFISGVPRPLAPPRRSYYLPVAQAYARSPRQGSPEFPRTKLLWAPTPQATAALFAALASGDDQPDVDAAQRHRDDGDAVFSSWTNFRPGAAETRFGGTFARAARVSLDTDALTRILGSDRARRFAAFCTQAMEPVPFWRLRRTSPRENGAGARCGRPMNPAAEVRVAAGTAPRRRSVVRADVAAARAVGSSIGARRHPKWPLPRGEGEMSP